MAHNLINTQCQIHKKPCEYICSYSKCAKNLICQKCRRQHLSRHPAQFIYELANLAQIHSFNKIDKLKQTLIKQKLQQEAIIRDIYFPFQNLTTPLNNKVKQFALESREMIQKELSTYLRSNKMIIEETEKKIFKSNTEEIKDNPNKMLEETINQAEIINKRESRIIQNGEGYKWYSDTAKKMCQNIVAQITSMISVGLKIIDNSLKLQRNKFMTDNLVIDNPQDASFFKRYPASTKIQYERHALESEVLKSKNTINWKDLEISKANKEVRQKVIKIQELQEKVEGLKQELIGWEQKAQIEEREKRKSIENEKKRKQEVLIKNGIIGSNGKSISLERKIIAKEDLPLILEIVPNPLCLDLSNHNLKEDDLDIFFTCSTIQILKFNFTRVRTELLIKLFASFPHLQQLQLNSAEIDDNILIQLSKFFPSKLRVLYLIDNKITDQGLEAMFMNMNHYDLNNRNNDDKVHTLDELYISYNKLTQRSIEIIHKYSFQIKKLHIAKNQLKGKGGQSIGKYLKDLEELFVGATGLNKDAFLAIVRNCLQLKKLSLVANQVSTEIVTQILLGLHQLKWLDISYCNMTKSDMEKIQKLKIFNKDLQIITTN